MSEQQAIVIGGGIGGLSAAVELAASGQTVTLLEKCPQAGGKMREVNVQNKLIDSGPTVFTMRQVFEDIFHIAGTELSDHIQLDPVMILARHAWSEEERLDLFADIQQSADAIGDFSGKHEAQNYLQFCATAKKIYQSLEKPFMLSSRPSPLTLTRRIGLNKPVELWRLNPFVTLWKTLEKQFSDNRIQQLFGRYSTYMGSSPYLAPATLMLIAHVEQDGVWTVRGGMYRLVEALISVAKKLGVKFRYDANVNEIVVHKNAVAAVSLESGESFQTSSVVLNADVSALASGQFGDTIKKYVPPIKPDERSLSAITWSLNTTTHGFPLVRHNVFFGDDYASEFDDIFTKKTFPNKPTVYVCAQDRHDQTQLGQNEKERLFCLINAPAKGDKHQFSESEINSIEQRGFDLMKRCGFHINREQDNAVITTPAEFEKLFPTTGGALYGRASHGWLASFKRPGSRTSVNGLYLAGGSVHPGAGIPMAAISGRLAATSVIEDSLSAKK